MRTAVVTVASLSEKQLGTFLGWLASDPVDAADEALVDHTVPAKDAG